MSLRGTNHSNYPIRFNRYGELQGTIRSGSIEIGQSIEFLPGQEVWLEQANVTDIVYGLLIGGMVNRTEVHEVITPVEAGLIKGFVYLSDIRGGYTDEPIIGESK